MNYDSIVALRDPRALFDLTGRVGLITGGAGKMGVEFAGILARSGAQVILSDLSEDICRERAGEVAARCGARVDGVAADVSDPESVRALFERVDALGGRLDFLVCNVMAKPAGYYRSFEEYDASTWDAVVGANLKGGFLCAQQAARRMRASGGGSIVMTSSIYGFVSPNHVVYERCRKGANVYGHGESLRAPEAYTASKAGVLGLVKHLGTQLAPAGIRVNALVPGGVYDGQEAAFHEAYVERTPMGRMAVWSDFNGAILFLVSDASRYMTGSSVVVDGGWTAW